MNESIDFNKSLQKHMEPFWEKQLEEFNNTIGMKFSSYLEKSQKIWQEDDNFKKMLFTISGGTLSIFATLGSSNSSGIMRFGFFLIAISMVCSLISQIFSPETRIRTNAILDISSIKLDENRLQEIKKHIDNKKNKAYLSLIESIHMAYKNQLKSDKNLNSPFGNFLEKILGWLNLDSQTVSDWQKYLFLLGILVIAISLFLPGSISITPVNLIDFRQHGRYR